MILILGAGLAGLSASYHIGHDSCLILESQDRAFGHIASERREEFTWDQGPHVSFTKHEYVRQLFETSAGSALLDIEVQVGNYYRGNWIAHPAQTALHQVPEPLRSACLQSFLSTRGQDVHLPITNYQQWLERAFGPVFANAFPAIYTQKFWTLPPEMLTTNWIGDRVLYPKIEEVKVGAVRAHHRSMHYITRVRYPSRGGYQSFAEGLRAGSNIRYGAEVVSIDLSHKVVWLASGERLEYDILINTLPLPAFVNACVAVPTPVVDAARRLTCTQLLLVNIAAPHPTQRPEHWIYVYDEDMLTTRVNFTEKLSPNNAPEGWTGVQAEVYFSRHRPLATAPEQVGVCVEGELIKMGLLDPSLYCPGASSRRHLKYAPWANVAFEHDTAPALQTIWEWLEASGLARDSADISPLTDWNNVEWSSERGESLFMAGRFGQWKYFWTDDVVLRGKFIAEAIRD